MYSKLIQDWVSVERTSAPNAPTRIVQSSPLWTPTEHLQDAQFFVDVRYVTAATHLYLRIETAPACDESLFLLMQGATAVDLVPFAASIGMTAFAGETAGPPLASWVRWVLDSPDSTWLACFRITMSAV